MSKDILFNNITNNFTLLITKKDIKQTTASIYNLSLKPKIGIWDGKMSFPLEANMNDFYG
jgi:hypothetical protein